MIDVARFAARTIGVAYVTMISTLSLGSELGGPIAASLRPAILDDEVATLGPAEFAQPLHKGGDPTALGCGHRYRAQEPDGGQLARLLRARRHWPRCRAAEQRDELAPIHVWMAPAW